MEYILEFIKPELVVLAVVLYLVGVALKKSAVKDKFIPLVLGVVSVVLATLYVVATSDLSTPQNVALAVFCSITQGVLCAGASVYINQLIKQIKKTE